MKARGGDHAWRFRVSLQPGEEARSSSAATAGRSARATTARAASRSCWSITASVCAGQVAEKPDRRWSKQRIAEALGLGLYAADHSLRAGGAGADL